MMLLFWRFAWRFARHLDLQIGAGGMYVGLEALPLASTRILNIGCGYGYGYVYGFDMCMDIIWV